MYKKNTFLALSFLITSLAGIGGIEGGIWTDLQNPGPGYIYKDVFFTDPNHGCLVVDDRAASRQAAPSIEVDDAGVIYLTWEDERNGNKDIYFSKSVDGGLSWTSHIRVNNAGLSDNQYHPSLAVNDAGSIIYIAWHDNRSGNYDIYLSKSLDGGQNWLLESKVNDDNAQNQRDASIVLDTSDNLYVVWSDGRDGPSNYIYFRKYNGATSLWEPEIRIDLDMSGDAQENAALSVDDTGGVFVVWQGLRDNPEVDIYFSNSSDGGASFEPEVRVDHHPAGEYQTYPSIFLQSSTIHVVWQNGSIALQEAIYTTNSDKIVIAFDGPDVQVDDGSADAQSPVISGNDTYLIVLWTEGIIDNYNVYMSKSTDAGSSWSNPDTKVNDDSTGRNRTEPVIIVDGSGRVIAAWRDGRNTNNDDIYTCLSTDQGSSWNTNIRIEDSNHLVGVIFCTSDGAMTPWVKSTINIDPVSSLWKIVFSSASIGWAVGDEGTILYTSDGGTNWDQQTWPERTGSEQLRSVFFIDELTGWIIGPTVLLSTIDGSNWSVEPSLQFAHDISFIDNQHGWAVGTSPEAGRTVFETDGPGISWTAVSQTADSLFGVSAVSSDNVWVSGQSGILMRYNGGDVELDWHQATLPGATGSADLHDVDISTAMPWFVCSAGSNGVIVHTPDEGINWIEGSLSAPTGLLFEGLSVVDWNNAWVVGNHLDSGGRILSFTCDTNEDCDDGLICNGPEICTPPCSNGVPPGDGSACEQACAWCQAGVCDLVPADQDPFNDCGTCRICDGALGCQNASNGTDPKSDCLAGSCDDCIDGACAPASGTCLIDSSCYNQGDPEPTNPCKKCDTASSSTAWTDESDGTTCGTCAWCQAGVCDPVPVDQDPFGDCGTCRLCDGALGCQNASNGTDPKSDCLAGSCDDCVDGACAPASGTCLIDSSCYNQGDPEPTNPCKKCDTASSSTAWTDEPDGTTCGTCAWCQAGVCDPVPVDQDPFGDCGTCRICDGALGCQNASNGTDPKSDCLAGSCDDCVDGACAPASGTCLIDSSCYNQGDPEPTNPCKKCDTASSSTAWTDESDGTTCGTCAWCQAGVCDLVPADQDPFNDCGTCRLCDGALGCQNASNGTDPKSDCLAGSCDDCVDGACAPASGTCLIDSSCYNQGDPEPTNPCKKCDTASSSTAWTDEPDGTTCGTCAWCQAGVCDPVPVDQDPFGDCGTCQICDGALGCQNASSGTDPKSDCLAGSCDDCVDGACTPASGTCLIDSSCHNQGDPEPTNPCKKCDTASSSTAWTDEFDGTTCGTCAWCQAGVCDPVPVDQDPFGDCGTCQICDGALGCQNASSGTDPKSDCLAGSCDDCVDGACAPASGTCLIDSSCYNQGDPEPTNPCKKCDTASSSTAWTDESDGTTCGTCAWCQAGVCDPVPVDQDPFGDCGTCQICDGALGCQNASSGTDPKSDCLAGSCDDCVDGACAPASGTCLIDSSCYNQGDPEPTNPCKKCDTASSSTGWTDESDGTTCGTCAWCQAGVCDPVPVDQDPFGDCGTCRLCDGALGCQNASNGTDPKGDCLAGSCDDCVDGACAPASGTCLIDSNCYNQGDPEPTNPCKRCDTASSSTGWTDENNGTACGNCAWCQVGSCLPVPTEQDPYADCGQCSVCDGALGCKNAADGTDPKSECLAGECDDCYGGGCAPAAGTCLIGGNCFDNGAQQPASPCFVCDIDQNTLDWTQKLDGVSCGYCAWCQAGSCDPVPIDQDPNDQCGLCQVCDGMLDCKPAESDSDPKDECELSDCSSGFCDGLGDCYFYPSGYFCGESLASECDQPDTCDGLGECQKNYIDLGQACGQTDQTECDLPDSCDGLGYCTNNFIPQGQGYCGGGCHSCDGAGGCDMDSSLEDGTNCNAFSTCEGICNAGSCMVEGFCGQPVKGCDLLLTYGIGEGQTLNCRLEQDKVTVRLYTDLSMLEANRLLPVRIELVNHDRNGWSIPLYGLELLLEFNRDYETQSSSSDFAYIIGTAMLEGGEIPLKENTSTPDMIVLTPIDTLSSLPVTTNGEAGWIVDLMLVFAEKRQLETDLEMSVWVACKSNALEEVGCHTEWDDLEHKRLDRQLVSNRARMNDVQDENSAYRNHVLVPAVGCQCNTDARNYDIPLILGSLLLGFIIRKARKLRV